jgi:rhodanese-related sulfurtransferase
MDNKTVFVGFSTILPVRRTDEPPVKQRVRAVDVLAQSLPLLKPRLLQQGTVVAYKNLTVNELDEFLTQPARIILDHRDPKSYASAHLPDAKPVSDRLIMHLMRANKETPVLVYCYHGNSSRDLATLLVNFGFRDVYSLEGGWQAWSRYSASRRTTISAELQQWLNKHKFSGADINSRIENGMSALMQAALMAERGYVRELLDAGVDVNLVNDDENNALWFACFSEDPGIIRSLIEHGVDVDNRNVNGATCLIYAASAGKLEVVKTLVAAGADIRHTTLDGYNALDSASTIGILRFLKPQYLVA